MNRLLPRAWVLGLLWVVPGGGPLVSAAEPAEDALTGELRRAWELLNTGKHEEAVRFVDGALQGFSQQAQRRAGTMIGFAAPTQRYDYHQVNIAGTLNYVRALAFQRSGRRDEWLAALRRTWSEFPFCQAWDPKGWWWKPAEAAKKDEFQEVIGKAVQDRSLSDSPFPKDEDALDSPQMTIALAAVIAQLLEQGDYAALEFLAGRIRDMPLRLPDGTWTLPFLYQACVAAAGPENEEASWDRTRDRLAAWRKALPDSVTAQVAEATRLIHHAWHVRGSGYADTVKPDAWPVFKKRIEEAKAVLEACPRTCPHWFETRLTVARAQGDTREAVVALFDEGWKAHPGYTPLINEVVTDLLPRWGGQPGDWHKMAKRVAKGTDDTTYTLFVNAAWRYEGATVLDVPGFDRDRFRRGWKKLLDERPGSLSLAHQCLVIALSLADSQLSLEAFRRTGKRYHPGFWKTPEAFMIARSAAGAPAD